LWNATSGKLLGEPWQGLEASVYSVAFSPDGKWVLSGGADNPDSSWDYTILLGFLRDWILERISQLDPAAWRGAEGSWSTPKETVMGELRRTRHHG
jgi:WD40 repeat protein